MSLEIPFKNLITSQDFFNFTGINLDKALVKNDKGNSKESVEMFLLDAARAVYQYLLRTNSIHVIKGFYEIAEIKEILALAQMEQAKYNYLNGNISADAGFDATAPISLSDIRGERAYSPFMIELLVRSGLMFGGLA